MLWRLGSSEQLPPLTKYIDCYFPGFYLFCFIDCWQGVNFTIFVGLVKIIIHNLFFRIYDMDNDGFVSNGELFQVLKMMVGNNLKDTQLQQIVDKTIILYDKVSLS